MRNLEDKKMKFAIVENAKHQARNCFLGIAIPSEVKNIDGEMIQVEQVLKFNRKALKNAGKIAKVKTDPRMSGGEDLMISAGGTLPGSRERVELLAAQYSVVARLELSAFGEVA